jgi:hypothetical protein
LFSKELVVLQYRLISELGAPHAEHVPLGITAGVSIVQTFGGISDFSNTIATSFFSNSKISSGVLVLLIV